MDFIMSRFHYLVPLVNNTENGEGVVAHLNGLTQYYFGKLYTW
jgi:hypothetical protein